MNNYRKLTVWMKAMECAVEAHRIARRLPSSERFGLSEQIRRSSVSIPSNIAEGQGRTTRGDARHFLGYARGSAYELETQLPVAQELGLVGERETRPIVEGLEEVSKMLTAMIGDRKAN